MFNQEEKEKRGEGRGGKGTGVALFKYMRASPKRVIFLLQRPELELLDEITKG